MEFKSSKTDFASKNKFGDDMKRFVVDEAARFTTESNEAASASVDEIAEKSIRFSREKNLRTVKEQKEILNEIKKKRKLHKKDPIYQSPDMSKHFSGDTFEKGSRTKEFAKKQESAKKEKKKEQKKAAAKTAVANMLRAKKDMSNDLASEQVSGNAFTDGVSGMLKTFAEAINPTRWVKLWVAKLGALLAASIGSFMVAATILIIILLFIFTILQPLKEVGDAIHSFLSVFTIESDTIRNTAFTVEEIDEIVANASCDETQEKVLRFALSKVSYPYSQDLRASGHAYDCSSFAYYAWKAAGVDISYGTGYPPTAAEEARMLKGKGKALDVMSLQPGDLVFYGGDSNGRYMGIYHVAIYVGKGKAVEALNTKYGVVYQTLRTKNAIMVCRPNK